MAPDRSVGSPGRGTKRIVFHEITKRAILEAIENPRTVDMNLVNAQQARRVLDRLVGFELSPVLWKKVRPSLSAGRVQSVAVRLLVEREREIIAFRSTPYFRVVAQFHAAGDKDRTLFKAELPTRFESREEAEAFLRSCVGATFTVAKVEEKPVQRYPAPPFTTSTLQQEAGRKLGMSVSQTMSVAQHLYEQGLITYMRTDSVNLSTLALAQCKEQITNLYGEKYSSYHNYKTKTKGAQEAHEAIRPSYIERQAIEGTPAEKRLYDLIWKRTVASQMVSAELDRTTITIAIDGRREQFVATGEVVRFDGFLRLYSESTDEEPAEDSEGLLPKLSAGDEVLYQTITATQRFTMPPARYNEASLVKRLEELGIGRPSTYAPTITTIINRGYVVKQSKEGQKRTYEQLTLAGGSVSAKTLSESFGKEKNRLQPTDIGMLVNDYLEQQFAPIIDYNFTANVEKEFDRVAEGDITWDKMIAAFYGPFHRMVDTAIETQSDKHGQARVLGADPKTGRTVKARIGRYGPMVEIEGEGEEKPRFASLKKRAAHRVDHARRGAGALRPAPHAGRMGGRADGRRAGALRRLRALGQVDLRLAGQGRRSLHADARTRRGAYQGASGAADGGQHADSELRRRSRHAGQERPLRCLHRLQGEELPHPEGDEARRTDARRVPENRRRVEEMT